MSLKGHYYKVSYCGRAPDELREPLRNMTRMQLIRTPGSWKPSASEYRNVTNVYRIALKSLA